MSLTRRDVLRVGVAIGLSACGDGGAASDEDAGVGSRPCATPSASGAPQYCLTAPTLVRVPDAARLAVGEAVLLNVDDNTAVIVARDAGGLHALSAICTHACCVVSLCDDDACGRLSITPPACGATERATADHSRGGLLCPCHGSVFRIADGAPISGPAMTPLPAYALTVEGGDVRVDTGARVDVARRI